MTKLKSTQLVQQNSKLAVETPKSLFFPPNNGLYGYNTRHPRKYLVIGSQTNYVKRIMKKALVWAGGG